MILLFSDRMMKENDQGAYIMRIAHGEGGLLNESLERDELIIGWAYAEGLLDTSLDWVQFREIIHQQYHKNEDTYRRSGAAAGHVWRFIREIKIGDLVVVPSGPEFYVAEVSGDARRLHEKVAEDSAYRRSVVWLNGKRPIPRRIAKASLLSRMKTQGTTASAHDLLDDIKECVDLASNDETPDFQTDLKAKLELLALQEMRSGRMDSYGFERLVRDLMKASGAKDPYIVPRSKDNGADVVGVFSIAGLFPLKVVAQAKHWQPGNPVGADVVGQLISGIEAEEADLGIVITSGDISEEAVEAASAYFENTGKKIEFVDGEQFSKLIIEHGIGYKLSSP